MNFKSLSKIRALFLITSIMLLTICVCVFFVPENQIVQQNRPVMSEPQTIIVSGSLVRRDIDNLFETSNLIVLCTITSEQESFFVHRVDDGIDILSDQFARIDKVFMGEPVGDGVNITIRSLGGTVGDHTVSHNENPVLQIDEQYLLFLYKPDMGGSYNTDGDYYYIRGLYQGVYGVTDTGEFVSHTGEKITARTVEIRAEAFKDFNYSSREQYIKNLKSNLEYEVITQDDYDKAISQMDEYAEIIEDFIVK